MSDDLRIPVPAGAPPISSSYRVRRPTAENGTRVMIVAAGVLGGALLLGMAGWAMLGRHPATVPVIEADSRPLRVKPDNPGGMQIAGADEQDAGDGTNRMAPAAEVPAPLALRAQMQQGAATTPSVAASAPVPAGTSAAAPAAAAPPGVSPLPDTPARSASVPRAAAPATPARPAAGGTTQVQLGALDSEAAAQAEWQRLSKRMPDLLADKRLSMQRAEREGHPVWRVRTGSFADIAEATGFCAKVRAKGGSCAIASF